MVVFLIMILIPDIACGFQTCRAGRDPELVGVDLDGTAEIEKSDQPPPDGST